MRREDTKKFLKIFLILAFFLFLSWYTYSRAHDLIFGVKIKDVNLVDGATVGTNVLEITGNAKNAIKLTLNGREISIDQEGNFKDTVALFLGYNVIEMRAIDKFGYRDEKNYQLIRK